MIMSVERLVNLLCLISFNSITADHPPKTRQRYARQWAAHSMPTCTDLARRAHAQGLDVAEVIAVSYVETRHRRGLVSKSGARGPLQALPKYWSRPADKDYVDAGLRAWSYYRARSDSTREAAGRYNGGGENSHYARAVERHARMLKEQTAWTQTPPR